MHYVSLKPVEIPNHVHAACADINSKTAFAKQAAADWQNISARAAELVPGGRFICLNFFGIDAGGRYLGNTGGKYMFDHFHKFWKALYEKGSTTKNEYEGATFVQYYRTMDEFCPFLDPNSDNDGWIGTQIEFHKKLTKCPYEAAFHDAGDQMSNREYAESLIPTMRSWSDCFQNRPQRARQF